MTSGVELALLLQQSESEWLDFKQAFHSSTVKLTHDILCLANAYANDDRYLVFGVCNDGTICGIEKDPNKKTNADIHDTLRQANFNRIPTVSLQFCKHSNGHTVGILTIKKRPDRPFFLVKDKAEGKERIRAGVIYTRLGDTNIPLDGCAPEDHIELMWRERFGFGLDPLSRLFKLLDEKEKWVQVKGETYLYHKEFPEFTVLDGEELNPQFKSDWTKNFPDPTAWSCYVEVRYLTTILKRVPFIACDGGRYRVPMPEPEKNGTGWFIKLDGLGYKISELYRQYFPLPGTLKRMGMRIVQGV